MSSTTPRPPSSSLVTNSSQRVKKLTHAKLLYKFQIESVLWTNFAVLLPNVSEILGDVMEIKVTNPPTFHYAFSRLSQGLTYPSYLKSPPVGLQ